MTGLEFVEKYDGNKLKEIARDISSSIVIRTYDNGNSRDTRREATKPEKEIIRNIVYGVMLAYGDCGCDDSLRRLQGILDCAEYTLMQFIPNCNTYDTIYTPLRKVTETF